MTTLSKVPRLRFSLEAIDFQNEGTGKKLEKLVEKIIIRYSDGDFKDESKAEASVEFQAIEDLIFRRFGLKIDLRVGYDHSARIYVYSVNRFNIMDMPVNHGIWDKDLEKHLAKMPKIEGTVNTKTARVSGVFSEFPSVLEVDFIGMDMNGHTVEEIVATIFHEVGHAFSVCEFADRTERTNQVLANCMRVVLNREEKNAAKYVYRELKTIDNKITEKDVDALVGEQRIIAGYNWMRYLVKLMNSQMSENAGAAYDLTAAEAMSDNFASRMGYGRHLLTSLDKDRRDFPDYPTIQNTQFAYLGSVIMFCYMATAMVVSLALGPFGIVMSAIFGMVLLAIIKGNGHAAKDYTYDDLRVRYKRIREDAIQHLKKEKIDKLVAIKAISDIRVFDRLINELGEEKTFYMDLARLMFKKDQQIADAVKGQRLLEELSGNDLFLKSAELTYLK